VLDQSAPELERRWLKRYGRRGQSGIQLLCFPYAGGSAGIFRHWSRLLPQHVEPVAVQLPGRADRFLESPYERMAPLLDDLIGVLGPVLGRPFACYGTSMGARVAWALAHALRERALPMPRALYVTASAAPRLDNGSWRWEGRADGLEGYVREMGGTPDEVLAEPELVAALLPTLRADLTVLSTHDFRPATPLDVRIRAFAGVADDEAPPARMRAWGDETSARFDLDVLGCGHFADPDTERLMVEAISVELA
jgi:medium-chain acyl-[acyl-carrier-protein] hydrolase